MENESDEFSYGKNSGLINVYLPRADVNHLSVPPPSPVFSLENVFKFSDQVLQDRHLFIHRKPSYFLSKDEDNRSEPDEKGDISSRSNRSPDDEKDDLSSVNVVRLTLGSSDIASPSFKDKRFNERLSAYVATKKKLQVAKSEENNGKPVNVSDSKIMTQLNELIKTPREIKGIPSVRKSKLRRGLSFHHSNTTSKDKLELPHLGSFPSNNSPRQKSKLTFQKEHSKLFPESISPGKTVSARYFRMPIRPSSKPQKIWRQSTDVLMGNHMPPIQYIKPTQPALVSKKEKSTLYRNKTLV